MKLTKTKKRQATTNHMGGKAYTLTPEMALYTLVVTSVLQDAYYEKATTRLANLRALVAQVSPIFVAKLAVYAREQMYLRSTPIVLVCELAKIHRGDSLVSSTIERIVQRPDDMTELLAYYQLMNERKQSKKLHKLSKQIQKGLARAFNKFDGYQLAKYNRKGLVSLRDALFLVHPKAKDEAQQALFDQLVKGNLPVPYTWETELSSVGQAAFDDPLEKQQAKAEKWETLVMSGRLGYMALLRNLRNILLQGTEVAILATTEKLVHKGLIRRSKQLPFRFLSAYAELAKLSLEQTTTVVSSQDVEDYRQVLMAAIERALEISIENIPDLEGKTLVLSDNSGSMFGDFAGKSVVSAMSSRKTADIANLFAVICQAKAAHTKIGLFGDRLIKPRLKKEDGIFANFQQINEAAQQCGGATETGIFVMFEELIQKRKMVDRIFIFSDCQVGTGCNWFDDKSSRGNHFNKLFRAYKKINPAVITYSVDLRGYGNTLFTEGVATIGGWSEKIFNMVEACEKGSSVLEEINQLTL
ncbi:MAG: TROVE domain-containing protein [Thermonemataceae bacterium]